MVDKSVTKIFSSIPQLYTPRLILRRILPRDAEDMFEYASLEEVTRYLAWEPHQNLKFTKNYIQFIQNQYRNGRFFDWGLQLRDGGKFIGTCGFTAIDSMNSKGEIGYVLNPVYRGNGLIPEAVSAVLHFGFSDLNLNRLEAKYIDGNIASEHVMIKSGMTHEGFLRNYLYIKGEYKDIHIYSILADEYFKKKYNI